MAQMFQKFVHAILINGNEPFTLFDYIRIYFSGQHSNFARFYIEEKHIKIDRVYFKPPFNYEMIIPFDKITNITAEAFFLNYWISLSFIYNDKIYTLKLRLSYSKQKFENFISALEEAGLKVKKEFINYRTLNIKRYSFHFLYIMMVISFFCMIFLPVILKTDFMNMFFIFFIWALAQLLHMVFLSEPGGFLN